MKDRRLLTIPGHAPVLDDRGWGHNSGPGHITVACTCGFVGLTVCERWFTPGKDEAQTFAEPFRTFVAQYGAEVMLSGDNDTYGTREDAIRLYLAHIGYDPEADRKRVVSDLLNAIDMVCSIAVAPGATLSQIANASPEATQALGAVAAAADRLVLWEAAPLLTASQPDPEGRRLIEAYHAERRARDAAAADEPVPDDVREALGLPPTT